MDKILDMACGSIIFMANLFNILFKWKLIKNKYKNTF